ncbi:MAG: cynT [Chlamydiia bacterium]|nr:cynT [Chlamydiia bacterium]
MQFCSYIALVSLSLLSSTLLSAMPPEEALKRLVEGNQRYVDGKLIHPNRDEETRSKMAEGQAPYAIILGCSDSRVPPEIIFDQGLGELFIVRVAGNVAGPIELDSIEFSAIHFKSAVILVLGHKNCGAVQAVLQNDTKDIESIAVLIEPAVKAAEKLSREGDLVERAVKMNVEMVTEQLRKNEVLAKRIESKQLQVVGGYYDLESGKVELLEAQ